MHLLRDQLFLTRSPHPSVVVELWSDNDPEYRSREVERSEMESTVSSWPSQSPNAIPI